MLRPLLSRDFSMSIKLKLISVMTLMALLLGVVTVIGLTGIHNVNQSMKTLFEKYAALRETYHQSVIIPAINAIKNNDKDKLENIINHALKKEYLPLQNVIDPLIKLQSDVGSAIQEVVAESKQVASLVTEISTASHEQSLGIGQINTAISHMETVTQQNAALVNESAAASSLAERAEELSMAVGAFRI